MTNLVTQDQHAVIHPLTGEQLELAHASMGALAQFLDDIRYHESQLRELKSALSAELTTRLDRKATLTDRIDGYEIKGMGATTTEYDAQPLADDLADLVAEGVIDQEAMEAAVAVEVVYKAKANGVKALLRTGNPRLREVVERHSREIPNEQRRISVRRLG